MVIYDFVLLVVSDIAKIVSISDQFVVNNDGSKITLINSQTSPTAFKWYSNKQLFAVINGTQRCLGIADANKLQDLDGRYILFLTGKLASER